MMMTYLDKLYDSLLSKGLSLLGFAPCAGLISCQMEYGPPTDYIDVNPSALHFPAEGGSAVIHVESNGNWTMTKIPTFIHATPTSGHGPETVTVLAEENRERSSRVDVIKIEGDESVTVTVYQTDK